MKGSRTARLLLLGGWSIWLSGCGFFGGKAPLAPDVPQADSLAVDSSGVKVAGSAPSGGAARAGAPDTVRIDRAPTGERAGSEPPRIEVGNSEVDLDEAVEDRSVSVDVPETEKRRLIALYWQHVDATQKILERTAGKTGAEASSKREVVNRFLEQARDALGRDDPRAASNLAYKARLLAEDLATP